MTSSIPLPTALSLEGKTALVTGGSRGIGRQISRELAVRGCAVALVFQQAAEEANAVVQEIKQQGGNACAIKADLARPDSARTIVQGALQGLAANALTILVNCAGADHPPQVGSYTCDQFERIMNINVRAPMLLVQELLPHLDPLGGRIINISSTLTRLPAGDLALYASSKAALECFSRHWALELGKKHHLTCNTISIGIVATHHVEDLDPEAQKVLLELPSAERRFGTPDDVAQTAAFLASDSARWINGDTIACNGGSLFI